MTLILISIILSSLLVICFKVFDKYKVNIPNAIALNYLSASACGFIAGYDIIQNTNLTKAEWLPYTLLFGLFFIVVFNLVGVGVKTSGLMVVAIAQKMSLIIPLTFSIWFYNESYGIMKITGIVLALVAIYFSSKKSENIADNIKSTNYLIPFLIFLGSGIVDVSIKISQEHFAKAVDFSVLLAFIFGAAGIVGISKMIITKQKVELKDLIAGLTLGLFNFSSTYFLMKALDQNQFESSYVFAINNIGIILFNSFVATIIFKENLSRINWLGIILALVSILFIYYSNAI
jgi:drug/metabolite transporter (DMT)-like permease